MKRKLSSKSRPTLEPVTQPVPLKQLKTLRTFGIKQLSAAIEMVGLGEQFVDQQIAIGFALKLLAQPMTKTERNDLAFDGMQYLFERGLLEIEPPPKSKYGSLEVIVRVSTAETKLTEDLIAAGLKPRSLGLKTQITEFRGRISRDSKLPDQIRAACGTVAIVDNPYKPEPDTQDASEQDLPVAAVVDVQDDTEEVDQSSFASTGEEDQKDPVDLDSDDAEPAERHISSETGDSAFSKHNQLALDSLPRHKEMEARLAQFSETLEHVRNLSQPSSDGAAIAVGRSANEN